MEQPVMLRILVLERHSRVDMICIDTDVAVSAPSLDAAKTEMKDALASYLQSFSSEDFGLMKFLRPAPFRFRFAGRWANRKCYKNLPCRRNTTQPQGR
jgi:hypothetical protein